MSKDAIKINLVANVDSKEIEGIEDEIKKVEKAWSIGVSRAIDKANKRLEETQARMEKISSDASKLEGVSSTIALAGAAMLAPIILSANKYIDAMREMGDENDILVTQWTDSNERIENSFLRIGKISTRAVLPLMEKAAELTEKTADFVEDNPDVVKAALNTGVALATLGAVGVAVSKGIRLYAEASYLLAGAQNLAAGQLMLKAAEGNLAASVIATKNAEITTLATGGVAQKIIDIMPKAGKALGSSFILVAAAGLGAAIGLALGNAIDKAMGGEGDAKMGDVWETYRKGLASYAGAGMIVLNELGVVSDETSGKMWDATKGFLGLGDAVQDAGNKAGQAGNEFTNKEFDLILSDYSDANTASIQKYAQQRIDAIDRFDGAVETANAALDSSIARAASNLNKTLSSLASGYNESERKASEAYNARRANISRSGAEEIEQIERDHQEEMLALEKSHNQSVLDFTDDRDALGLSKEKARYEEELTEKSRQKEIDIADSKNKTSKALADAARAESLRSAQAKRAYNLQVKAAHEQHKAAVELARKQHEEKLASLELEKKKELAAVQKAQREERIALIKERNAQLVDLDGALSKERELKRKYYIAMLDDMRTINEAQRAANYMSIRGKASGGYVGNEIVQTGEKGREFIMTNQSTLALEKMLGGALSQERIVNSVRKNITVTDNRRFDSRLSADDRRSIVNDISMELVGALI